MAIMATTIINSISVKPLFLRMLETLDGKYHSGLQAQLQQVSLLFDGRVPRFRQPHVELRK
ncbi:MAG: hypothetical protein A2341_28545 [Deltaproteobacteria bacterium RIFOXYB12_FULL_58_9]|nr:MAG: hypothetical protein A2341_28545 [Deltaproteobacteria bacterium RIFOXYB12_FULL_58_9]